MATEIQELALRDYNINIKNERSFTRSWRVIFDDVNTHTGDEAVDAAEIYIKEPYKLDAYLLNITSSSEDDDGYSFIVEAKYGPYPSDYTVNPLDKPYELSWSLAPYQTTTIEDIDGSPILNTAGDPFDPIEIDDSRVVLTVTRNEASFDGPLAWEYRDAINSDEFLGSPPRTVKVAGITARRHYDQTVLRDWFFTVTYNFHFNADGWRKKILSTGLRELVNGKREPIYSPRKAGSAITTPAMLDKNGKHIPNEDELEEGEEAGEPHWLEKKVYKELPFSTFNIT